MYELSDKEKARRAEASRIYALKMTTWGFSLSKNTSLYHIDLSYNEFNEIDLRLLVRALNKNSTMMGVHLEGNPGLHNFKINRNLRG